MVGRFGRGFDPALLGFDARIIITFIPSATHVTLSLDLRDFKPRLSDSELHIYISAHKPSNTLRHTQKHCTSDYPDWEAC